MTFSSTSQQSGPDWPCSWQRRFLQQEAEGWSFTVPTTMDGEFVSPAFVGSVPAGTDKGVRMYVKIPGHDWWHSEFVVLDGKIKYRATGGDQDRVTGEVGHRFTSTF